MWRERGKGGKRLLAQLSYTYSLSHHAYTLCAPYCSPQIQDTPFSLCVVIPKGAYDCEYAEDMFTPPIKAHYHTLDILADKSDLCRQVAQYATPSTCNMPLKCVPFY